MAKRFTDSDKWKKGWFRKLPADMKLFWVYVCDNCNIAGIWEVDFELASFFIGSEINEAVALRYMEKQVEVINPKKWLIVDFVPFQYGKLVPNNNLHRSVLNTLEISGASQGLTSPKAGDKVKVKVKDKVIKERIVKENQPEKIKHLSCVYLSEEQYVKLKQRFGEERVKEAIFRLNNYIESKGKHRTYKSHYHTILNWETKNDHQPI